MKLTFFRSDKRIVIEIEKEIKQYSLLWNQELLVWKYFIMTFRRNNLTILSILESDFAFCDHQTKLL